MEIVIPVGIPYEQMREDIRAIVRHELNNIPAALTGLPTDAADELLSIRETATLLGVTVQTVHEWKRRGLLKYHKLGSRSYLKRADVLAALQGYQRTNKKGR
jgi:excisionase family DNA binding protein